MLLREDERGVLAIGQQSHAWLSGQLARAWGNERFGDVEPHEEVCLAAEQHDAGWTRRDLEPLYNPDTGLPRSFMQMPLDEHLAIWTDGPERLLSQSRYGALLASLHGWRLYARRDLARLPSAEADAIRRFLDAQRAFQADLIAGLRSDPATAPAVQDPLLHRNSMLIWTWDYLSLALCLGWASATAEAAPTLAGEADLELTAGEAPRHVRLSPWPFAAHTIAARCEGRRLEGRFDDEPSMRAGLERASWETLEVRLEPGPDSNGWRTRG